MTKNPPCQLYLLTPPVIADMEAFADGLASVLSAAPVAALQLRLKPAEEAEIRAAAHVLLPIARAHNTAFIINDSPGLARACGADGVHLGQSDMSVRDAKELLPGGAIIGATCHNSKHLAFSAGSDGADYVAFGSFFPSRTKPEAVPADLELLTWWHETMQIPSVAIGGITPDNAREVIRAGADFIAVSSGVWDWPDASGGPRAAVSLLSDLCAQHSPGRN